MKLSIGIVGLPNVGKSTLFKLLTSQEILIANYPFATIDPNVGVVPVPDERLEKLNELSKSKKKIPAVVEFLDIAGLVKGAHEGEGLGNQFLTHIRDTAAVVMVLRVFKDDAIIHVENSVDPVRDLEILESELAFKDLEVIEKVLDKVDGEAKTGAKEAVQARDILIEIKASLEKFQPFFLNENLISLIRANKRIKDLNLLTAKKQLFLLNGKKEDVPDTLIAKILELGGDFIVADLGSANPIPELIQKAYKILDLISFFTTGEDETRAWTIRHGAKAPEAAGTIHTDFEKNFIRAEVVHWDKLSGSGGWVEARQKGLIRVEGKEYEVKDGDVMVIRHG
jgi:ribosome-binding ATPase YchF (GTP1/OBG family)